MRETTESWKKHNYEWVLTEDQSPTLRWLGSETLETMHHRGGAYSETQVIYGNPLRESLKAGEKSAVSVGLGVGYNEILVACEALQAQIKPQEFRLLSYESDPFLKTHFLEWTESPADSNLIYDLIFEFFQESDHRPSKSDVKGWLKTAHQMGAWKLEGALMPGFESPGLYACIFYDAFSSKTSPHLWQEDFLKEFFQKVCDQTCWMSTYACTGALKRALRAENFELVIRDGFQSKRNSTLGLRQPNNKNTPEI